MGFSISKILDPGDLFGGRAAHQAGELQARAAERNYGLQRDIFDRLWNDAAPVRETRDAALGAIEGINAGGNLPFDPGYGVAKRNLLQGNARNYSSRGKLLSGERLLADSEGVSRLASNEVQKAQNRLLNLAGYSTQDVTNQNRLLGHNIGSQGREIMDAGTARASGIMGQQNAFNDMVNTGVGIGSYYYNRFGRK